MRTCTVSVVLVDLVPKVSVSPLLAAPMTRRFSSQLRSVSRSHFRKFHIFVIALTVSDHLAVSFLRMVSTLRRTWIIKWKHLGQRVVGLWCWCFHGFGHALHGDGVFFPISQLIFYKKIQARCRRDRLSGLHVL